MFFWFLGGSVAIVWLVFGDPAIDYRLVMAGALLPDLLDAPLGGPRLAHSLVASVVLLLGVMAATASRRRLRRQLLALPIGTFLHLVLDGVWAKSKVFWWPFLGRHLAERGLPSLSRPLLVVVLEEAVGMALLVALASRFRLREPDRRRLFLTTGRFSRDLAGPGPGAPS